MNETSAQLIRNRLKLTRPSGNHDYREFDDALLAAVDLLSERIEKLERMLGIKVKKLKDGNAHGLEARITAGPRTRKRKTSE